MHGRDRFANTVGSQVRSWNTFCSSAMRLLELSAMEAQLRKLLAAQTDVRVALVFAKDDVVARLMRLDEIVFEKQRFAFVARDRRLDSRDLPDHRCRLGLVIAFLEIARDALLEVARLADVDRLLGRAR